MNKNIVDKFVEARDARLREEEEKKKAAIQKAANELLESLRAHLGDFCLILEEKKIPIKVKTDRSDNVSLEISIPALDDYRLAPIAINWNSRTRGGYGYHVFTIWGRTSVSTIAEALGIARDYYDEYSKASRANKVEVFEHDLNWHYRGRDKTEEQVRSLHSSFIAEFPELTEAADLCLDRWLENRRDYLRRKEEEDQAQKDREEKEASDRETRKKYIGDLVAWLKEYDRVQEKNNSIAGEIQGWADKVEYWAYKLTYAVVSEVIEDGESEKYIETREVWTLQSENDSAGYWIINGEPVKYFYPVSLKPSRVRASSGILAKKFERGGVSIFFAPYTSDGIIESATAGIEDLPKRPERPSIISEYSVSDYVATARRLLAGKEEGEEQLYFW